MASHSSEETPPTKLCGNCRRNVLSANYDMHSVHCQRFMRFCDYCDQVFSKSEWDKHVESFHGEVICKDCGKSVERKFLDEHLNKDCRFRQYLCTYCSISLPFCKSEEHESFCGSRTELCSRCNKYVKIRDLDQHFCGVDGDFSNDRDAFNDVDFDVAAEFRSKKCDFCNRPEESLGMSLNNHKEVCPEQPVSCKYCPEKIPMFFLESHEAVCPGMMVTCPTCLESIRPEQIDRHSTSCQRFYQQNFLSESQSEEHVDSRSSGLALNDFDGLVIKEGNAVKLPCEFCHRLFSIDMLIQHESGCDMAGTIDFSDARLTD